MNPYKEILQEILNSSYIVITGHKSPDGDSVGSSLGLYHFISKLGKNAVICHPDPSPDFLSWLENVDKILTMTRNPEEVVKSFSKADLIFCLDYNAEDRVGPEMQALLQKSEAKKIMIDHHLDPADFAFITVSEPEVCSTSQLIFELIEQSGKISLLDSKTGTPLYLGILTDTGTFRFPSVQPRTHQVISKLLEAGVQHHIIHENLNDNNTVSRMKLQGFAISHKLELLEKYHVAVVSLTEEELKRFGYEKGDTDGIVNMTLSLKGIKAAVFLYEKDGIIKISFRSKGKENPVNVLASENFSGGGHANASGGMSSDSMEETLVRLKSLIPLYFPQ